MRPEGMAPWEVASLSRRPHNNGKWGVWMLGIPESRGPMDPSNSANPADPRDEQLDEARKLRRLQLMISMVLSVIAQDSSLTLDEATEMVANARRAALAMFPGKELAFDLIYKPRLQRMMRERFRLQ